MAQALLDTQRLNLLVQLEGNFVQGMANNTLVFERLRWANPNHQLNLQVDHFILQRVIDLLQNGLTITLQDLWYECDEEFDDPLVTRPLVMVSLNRIVNNFQWPRCYLPLIAPDARWFYRSANVNLQFTDVNNQVHVLPSNYPAPTPIPHDYEMRHWDAIRHNADFQLITESHGDCERIINRDRLEDYFDNFIVVNSGGYSSHAMRTFCTHVSNNVDGNGVKCASRCFGDHDGHNLDLMLVDKVGTFGNEAVENEDFHLIEDLIPLYLNNLYPNCRNIRPKDTLVLRTVDIRLHILAHTATPADLARWTRTRDNIRNNGQVLKSVHIPNIVTFFWHHPDMIQFRRQGVNPPGPHPGAQYY